MFDANAALFETLLGESDAIFSDKLVHASLIDGVRLCKAQRFVYDHSNMVELEANSKNQRRVSVSSSPMAFFDGWRYGKARPNL